VLARGYSLVLQANGRVVQDAARLRAGEPLDIRFHHGRAAATVVAITPD